MYVSRDGRRQSGKNITNGSPEPPPNRPQEGGNWQDVCRNVTPGGQSGARQPSDLPKYVPTHQIDLSYPLKISPRARFLVLPCATSSDTPLERKTQKDNHSALFPNVRPSSDSDRYFPNVRPSSGSDRSSQPPPYFTRRAPHSDERRGVEETRSLA